MIKKYSIAGLSPTEEVNEHQMKPERCGAPVGCGDSSNNNTSRVSRGHQIQHKLCVDGVTEATGNQETEL